MQPSRRAILRVGGATTLMVLSGCAGLPVTKDESNPDLDVSSDVPFHVQLVGPETDERLFSGPDVTSVGSVRETRSGEYGLPITASESAIGAITDTFQSAGVAENPGQFEIVQYHGPEIARFTIVPDLADSIVDEEWDGDLQLHFEDRGQADAVRDHLAETSG
jgi:hypothetical protein